ncbi:MAG TPA: permease [Eubacterium sp.]|nr:permease [Eubacterium sp.]
MHYRNFKTVVYLPAWIAKNMTSEKLASDYEFLEKYIGLDKIYLETHRDDIDIDKEQILMIKNFLESKGVEVSGGITTVTPDFEGAQGGKRRLFNTLCYTDPAMREKVKEISEYTASLFDEVILDDFYFTNCSCESCIKAKGDRDWVNFRKELMMDVSKNLIVDPAKKVNPKVKMVVKYPNWRESYHFTGYLPKEEQDIFDATYIGTETRSPKYADQHLPEYLSYSLVRYMENAWPGKNGGGWFDIFQCWSSDRYLEQGYLTAFAKAKELMHFEWSNLIDNRFVGGMGIQLKKIDDMLDDVGNPTGVATYIPYESSGENHIEMRLGMIGIPIEATPNFPSNKKNILLTGSSAYDKDVVKKLSEYVKNGGEAVITTGFLKKCGDELRAAGLTEAMLTDRKINVTRYQMTGDWAGYIDDVKPIIFPEIVHGNNESWSLLNGGDGDYHTSLVLMSTYGKGRIFIVSIPDNQADIYRIPRPANDVLKRIVRTDTYASGKDFSMFTYDDGSMIFYRYVKGEVRPAHIKVYTEGDVSLFKDETNGREYKVESCEVWEDFEKHEYKYVDIILFPGEFIKAKWK